MFKNVDMGIAHLCKDIHQWDPDVSRGSLLIAHSNNLRGL
jgi:hypothetical protein